MTSREELRELAAVESLNGCAISFYYQPESPQDGSHKRESILVKDLVRDAQRRFGNGDESKGVREDLERILKVAEQIPANGGAKAIFACAEQKTWREFDVPSQFEKTQLFVNSKFHLAPLAAAVLSSFRVCVVLADREHYRILDYSGGELREIESVTDDVPRKVRTDGFKGFNAGHSERHVENEEMKHFKKLASRLQEMHQNFDHFVFGCRAEVWSEVEPSLHSYVRQRLVGNAIDPALVSAAELRDQLDRTLGEYARAEQDGIIRETIGEAQRDGRGSLGLRKVLISLERGEVQTLLIGRNFEGKAVQCTHCSHMDTRLVEKCAVCANLTREHENIADALVGRALTEGYDIVFADDDPEFESSGNIGALLRFRSDQNTPEKLAG